ncbi:hypothetical protein Egran_05572, partial [Elaphomyces granulatus]
SAQVGPPRLPLIGNIHQIPKTRAHLRFTEWSKKYGGLYSLKIGPASAVVITDRRLVKELFDKKSAIYSARPPSYVSQVLISGGDHLLVMNHGDTWRTFRKTVHQHFMESMCEKEHIRLLEAEHTQMMRDFLLHPEQHMFHTKRTANSIIMSLLFGIRTQSCETPHMTELYDIMERWSQVMETGATPPVDILPVLKWIPEKLLGSWVERSMDIGRRMKGLYGSMRRKVTARRQGTSTKHSSFLDHVLDQQEKLGFTENQVDFMGGVMMEGGSDTSSTMLLVLIQAIILHPEIQQRAQAQLDEVCGEDRSPNWADYQQLPYISMIIKETMRWRPVTPLAFPHALSKDDWVDGKFLPQGTTVFLNVWGLHHDEDVFPNSDLFDPSRYEGRQKLAAEYAAAPDYKQRDHYIYGAGRRICPGIHLAERSMFLGAAKLLWAFRFEQKIDAQGNPIPIDTDPITGYSEGFLVCPLPFQCNVTPRSKSREAVILREFAWMESDILSRYSEN